MEKQPFGYLTECQLRSGISYTCLHKAKTRLVTPEIAKELVVLARGAFKASDMERPRVKRVKQPGLNRRRDRARARAKKAA